MKMPRNYISLAFARYNPLQLAGFAENITLKMPLIAVFTPSEPPMAAIVAAILNLRLKQETFIQGGGSTAKAERDAAFDTLEGLLRELAAFVEDKAKNDEVLMRSTGFEVTTASSTPAVIVIPGILSIENIASTKLQFKIQSCGARAYEIWGQTGTDPYVHLKTLTDPRNGTVENLLPGALYNFKVRGVYPNNTYSDWSDVTSHRST